MVITELEWGLGNQLFQYAAGLGLARHLDAPLLVDISNYEKGLSRELCLKYFEIHDLITELDQEFKDLSFEYYEEPHFHFDCNFFSRPNFIYLSGFWQTEKYFVNIKREISERFQIKKEYIKHLELTSLDFQNYNSINLHIRRGDYAVYGFLGIQPMNYYYQAIEYFKNHFTNLRFYIFSDDIAWVKENLQLDVDHVFVSEHYTKNSIEDFYLMQHCKHHIIANSTFSWWAAWLSKNQDKIVIAPSKWFLGKQDVDTKDLIPKDWLTI